MSRKMKTPKVIKKSDCPIELETTESLLMMLNEDNLDKEREAIECIIKLFDNMVEEIKHY